MWWYSGNFSGKGEQQNPHENVESIYGKYTRVGRINHEDKLGQSKQNLVAIESSLDFIPYVMGRPWRVLSKGVT